MPASAARLGFRHGRTAPERPSRPMTDPAPTLAAAPEGLSARRVEHWLDLPPGAWQRRHLYALKVSSPAFEGLGFRVGDIVVVEPGVHDRPGKVVITKSPKGIWIRRIPATRAAMRASRIPTVLELPFASPGLDASERIVGGVIGHLRPTGTGALRPVVSPTARSPRRLRAVEAAPAGEAAGEDAPRTNSSPEVLDELEQVRSAWRSWIEGHRDEALRDGPGCERLERWERLDASLHALCECLERTHSANLKAALNDQAKAVLSAIRAEMRG